MSLYASFLPVTHQVHKEDNVLHTLAFEVQVTSSYLKLSQVFEGGGEGGKDYSLEVFFSVIW